MIYIKNHIILMMLTTILLSAYLENIPVIVQQPNGSSIDCFATGDEYYARLHDANNYTIIQSNIDGYYYYAESINGDIVPSIYKVNLGISAPEPSVALATNCVNLGTLPTILAYHSAKPGF